MDIRLIETTDQVVLVEWLPSTEEIDQRRKKEMTRKEIIKYFKGLDIDNIYKNVAMFLIDKKHFNKYLHEIDTYELDLLIDRLRYNNKIIESYNIDEYKYLDITKKQYESIKKGKKILLRSYYNINGKIQHCKIFLDNVNYYNF